MTTTTMYPSLLPPPSCLCLCLSTRDNISGSAARTSSAASLPSTSTPPPTPSSSSGATNGGGGGEGHPPKNPWNKIPVPDSALLEATPILGDPSSWPDLCTASKKKAPRSRQVQISSQTPVGSSIGETRNLPLPPSTPPPSLMPTDLVVDLNNDLAPSSAMTSVSIPSSEPRQEERTNSIPVVPQTEHQQQLGKEEPVDSVPVDAIVLQTKHQQQPEQEAKDLVSVPTAVLQMEHQQQKRQEEPTGSVPVSLTVLQVEHHQEPQVSAPASGMNPGTLIPPPHSRTSGQNNFIGRNNWQQHQNHNKNSGGRYQQRRPYHQDKLNHQFCHNQGGVRHIYKNNFYSQWNQDHQQQPLHFLDRFSCGGFGATETQHWPVFHGPPFVNMYYHPKYENPNGFCYTEPSFRGNMEVYRNGFYDPEPSFRGNMEVYCNGFCYNDPSFRGNMEVYRNGFYDPEPSFQGNVEVYRNDFCDPEPSFQWNMAVYPNGIYCPEPSFQDVSASRNHAPSVPFLSPSSVQTPTQVVPLPLPGTLPLPACHPRSQISPLHMSMTCHKFAGGLVPHSQLTAVDSGKKKIDLKTKLCKQIDFYFCDSNLPTDKYLKSLMDREGWVSVNEIAGFNRVKSMTTDVSLILEALQSSDVVEVSGNKMRKRGEWGRYISPEQVGSLSA